MKGKREELRPKENDTRYIRRDNEGQFTKQQVEKGRSLAQDRKQKAQKVVPKGQGDRGDQKRKAS
jgi:hypothetical protein